MAGRRRSVLQSKVARRILTLFVLCALLPVGVLAGVVLVRSSARMRDDGLRQLQDACKARGMAVYERLQLLDAQMRMSAAGGPASFDRMQGNRPDARSIPLARIPGAEPTNPMFGPGGRPPALSAEQWAHLGRGKPLIVTEPGQSRKSGTYLVRSLDPERAREGTLWARIGSEDLLDFGTLVLSRRLFILDEHGKPIETSAPAPAAMIRPAATLSAASSRGVFEWKEDAEPFLGCYWSLFLKVEFGAPDWTIVLSESTRSLESSIEAFQQTLVLSLIFSVAVVSLLSIILIRRTLGPIAVLHAGTRELAQQHFDHRVRVRGGDEFGELAHSFNTMAERTGHQFRLLETLGDVQRAILSTLDRSQIIGSFLARMPELLECVSAGVILIESREGAVESYVRVEGAIPVGQRGRLDCAWIDLLGPDVQSRVIEDASAAPGVLDGLVIPGVERLVLLPIHFDRRLYAIVAVGCESEVELGAEDISRVRSLSGQMAIGLANARLVRELEQLNWGTLSALARAIDAKSPWTMGHSERVMELACRIGDFMGLGVAEVRSLRRGALLHDIGKIGSPADLLEKAGRLTDEEFAVMKDHVRLGVRILEPIAAFADAIPVVLEHHERLDGSGYPAGLQGEAISLHARIVAVADCFDAMRSERPYRKGIPTQTVLDVIRAEAGKTLDEDAVAALVHIVTRQRWAVADQPTAPGVAPHSVRAVP